MNPGYGSVRSVLTAGWYMGATRNSTTNLNFLRIDVSQSQPVVSSYVSHRYVGYPLRCRQS